MTQLIADNRASFLKLFIKNKDQAELDLIMKAYDLSKSAHRSQTRDDGTEYRIHLRETALILVNLGFTRTDLIISSLLHDMIEDRVEFMDGDAIEIFFGKSVAYIVKIVTKPKKGDKRFKDDG